MVEHDAIAGFQRIDGDGAIVERTVGLRFWLELVGQDGRALTFDDQWKSMDVVTGDIAWSIPFGKADGAPAGMNTGAPNSQRGGPTTTAGACADGVA